MCRAISILKARIRQELFEEYELSKLIHERGSEKELWFDYAGKQKTIYLPIMRAGNQEIEIMEWGNRGRLPKLPVTGWCQTESLEAGKWRWLHPEPCEIPANFGLDKGIWFQINQGVKGIIVRDQQEREHAYMLTEASSHYFQTMTKHDRMPALIEQTI